MLFGIGILAGVSSVYCMNRAEAKEYGSSFLFALGCLCTLIAGLIVHFN